MYYKNGVLDMNYTTVSTKGAVVIPANLRRQYGLTPGSKVAIFEDNGRVQILPLSDDPVRSLRGCLKTQETTMEMLEQARYLDNDHEQFLMGNPKNRTKK